MSEAVIAGHRRNHGRLVVFVDVGIGKAEWSFEFWLTLKQGRPEVYGSVDARSVPDTKGMVPADVVRGEDEARRHSSAYRIAKEDALTLLTRAIADGTITAEDF